jgi:hypothetical protein
MKIKSYIYLVIRRNSSARRVSLGRCDSLRQTKITNDKIL